MKGTPRKAAKHNRISSGRFSKGCEQLVSPRRQVKTKQYVDKTFKEQMEVANLTGNVSVMNGDTYTHLHCVLGRSDYSALAGHLLSAHLNGAGEIVITTFDSPMERYHDEETGLNMYKI